ncbi:uncharacterized protein METZ01_LOCUS447033, partial [marine metagenome]
MHILLTNDDGYQSPGLRSFARELEKLGRVSVVAPLTQKSAISSSITLYSPLMAFPKKEKGFQGYAV